MSESRNSNILKTKIIHLGGTFGMIKCKNFFKVEPKLLSAHLRGCDRFNHNDDVNNPFYEFNGKRLYFSIYEDEIKDSSNLELEDCAKLSNLIKSFYNCYDSFIIIHGTDTMSFSASALSLPI